MPKTLPKPGPALLRLAVVKGMLTDLQNDVDKVDDAVTKLLNDLAPSSMSADQSDEWWESVWEAAGEFERAEREEARDG